MQDPVILFPSGNTYDCEQICKSLLHHPNLDPSSGVRYDSKLQYCDNLAVRKLLMETYGDKAFQKYDDSGFQARYDKAWNREHDRVEAAAASAAAAAATVAAAVAVAVAAAAAAAAEDAVTLHRATRQAQERFRRFVFLAFFYLAICSVFLFIIMWSLAMRWGYQ
jgi:hypothetical protein